MVNSQKQSLAIAFSELMLAGWNIVALGKIQHILRVLRERVDIFHRKVKKR